ncbi:MAG: hypothetical protein GYB58_09815 [Gammaproteobacteria bacterium]|nr:hypothetical protein [Gammaproteobacteria bacterium]MDG6097746.1 hypothetical protein [Alteromonas sp. ZYF713]
MILLSIISTLRRRR